jgi:hypothetical protein
MGRNEADGVRSARPKGKKQYKRLDYLRGKIDAAARKWPMML